MNGDHTERLPQENERHQDGESGILESASTFAHRVLEEIEALAGTTSCKSVQLVRLKKWAQEQGCWFNDRSQFGDFFDRGSENETYLSLDQKEIIKLNDFRYADDNLTSFFDRIKAHNKYFPDCRYNMIGFAENQENKTLLSMLQIQVVLINIIAFHQGQVLRKSNPDLERHHVPFNMRGYSFSSSTP